MAHTFRGFGGVAGLLALPWFLSSLPWSQPEYATTASSAQHTEAILKRGVIMPGFLAAKNVAPGRLATVGSAQVQLKIIGMAQPGYAAGRCLRSLQLASRTAKGMHRPHLAQA